MRNRRSRQIIGTADEVKADIENLMCQSGADEAILLTITPSFEDRLKSYELISAAFDMIGDDATTTGCDRG